MEEEPVRKKKAVKPIPKCRQRLMVFSDDAKAVDRIAERFGIAHEHIAEFPHITALLPCALTPEVIREAKAYHRAELKRICNRPGVKLVS